MIYKTYYTSPIGELTLASNGESLVGLWLPGQKYFQAGFTEMTRDDSIPIFSKAFGWLKRYFAGDKPHPDELTLSPQGSDFRRDVWDALLTIPYGQVTTYGNIGALLDRPKMSARAIGGAVGHNPISIIIPCHRVIGANNKLTGYAGGIDNKIWLLHHEGLQIDGDKIIR